MQFKIWQPNRMCKLTFNPKVSVDLHHFFSFYLQFNFLSFPGLIKSLCGGSFTFFVGGKERGVIDATCRHFFVPSLLTNELFSTFYRRND
jgi:hypothetical protein